MLSAWVTMMTLLAASDPAVPPRFVCDTTRRALFWELDGATVRADAGGLALLSTTITEPARSLAASIPAPLIKLEASDGLAIRGTQIESCQKATCRVLGKLPVTIRAAATKGETGVVVAGAAPRPGLYWLDFANPLTPSLLTAGDVLSLCPSDGAVWALLWRDGEAWLVAIKSNPSVGTEGDPALMVAPTFSFGAALLVAIDTSSPTVSALGRAFAAATRHRLPERDAMMASALGSSRPDVRSLGATLLASSLEGTATARLGALSRDPDAEVRRAALAAITRAVPQLPAAVSTTRLALFRHDEVQDIAWSARDLLLDQAAELALGDASAAYKIDALAILLTRCERDGVVAIHGALRLLVADNDDAVRTAALALDRCLTH